MNFIRIIILLGVFNGFAQQPLNTDKVTDSLYGALKTASNDSLKASIYYNLVSYLIPKDSVKTNDFLIKAKKLSGKSKFLNGVYYAKLGYLNYYKQDFDQSKKFYLKSDSILKNVNHTEAYRMLSDVWNNISVIEQINDKDDIYTEILLNKAIPYAKKANDEARLASLYNSLGVGFMNIDQNQKAITYFLDSEKLIQSSKKNQHRLSSLYNRMAENYLILDNIVEAKMYLDKNYELLKNNKESEQYSLFLLSKGFYFFKTKEYQKAIDSYDEGILSATGPNREYHIQELRIYKVKAIISTGNFPQALQEAQILERDPMAMEVDQNKLQVLDFLRTIYKALGNTDKAYYYLNEYTILNQELSKLKIAEYINQLETIYKDTERDKEVQILKNKQRENEEKLKTNTLYTILSVLGMFVFLLTAILIYNYYLSNKKLLQQKEIIHQQRISESDKDKRIAITNAILEGQENERHRVAKELHDGLGGLLAGISIKFSAWESNIASTANKESFADIKNELDRSINDLRNISRNLMPEGLLSLGLETALNDLCQFYQSDDLKINFQYINSIQANPDISVQLNIFRIVQELLTNAIKHAKASQILVQCTQNEKAFFITVEDNGIGFNSITEYEGMGLRNIKNRVAYLNGTFEIESIINQGTNINIELYTNHLKNGTES